MNDAPLDRRTASQALFERLRDDVLAGRLRAGDPLPSERALAERFAVNRHVVREAVKRLQQAGLVAVAQGGSTRVLDWRADGGLDLLGALPLDDRVVADALAMRRTIGVDAAGACASRAPAELLDRLPALSAAVARRDEAQRDGAPGAPYRALWTTIVEGSGNVAYRLALNTLVQAIDRHAARILPLLGAELRDGAGRDALVDAIVARHVAGARRAAAALLTTAA